MCLNRQDDMVDEPQNQRVVYQQRDRYARKLWRISEVIKIQVPMVVLILGTKNESASDDRFLTGLSNECIK